MKLHVAELVFDKCLIIFPHFLNIFVVNDFYHYIGIKNIFLHLSHQFLIIKSWKKLLIN